MNFFLDNIGGLYMHGNYQQPRRKPLCFSAEGLIHHLYELSVACIREIDFEEVIHEEI